jgi:hypothetical protein
MYMLLRGGGEVDLGHADAGLYWAEIGGVKRIK